MQKKVILVLGLVTIIIVVIIAGTVGTEFGKSLFSSSKSRLTQIEKNIIIAFTIAANQFNKGKPIMVDEVTRWDKMEVGPGIRLTYLYTLLDYSSNELKSRQLLAKVKPEIIKKTCTNKEMKYSMRHGATYVYVYHGNDGIEITRFEINKNDCN